MDDRARFAYADDASQPRAASGARVDASNQAPWPGAMPARQASTPFVLPGALPSQAQLSAHGGTIGLAVTDPLDLHAFSGHPQQQWAFATPHGYQLVEATPAPMTAPTMVATTPMAAHAAAAPTPAPGATTPTTRRPRPRWETIVPVVAFGCFLAAVALFISDFDRITGRDASARAATEQVADGSNPGEAEGAGTAPATPLAQADVTAVVDRATKMLADGEFEDARRLIAPYRSVEEPEPAVTALAARIERTMATNDRLLRQLTAHRTAKRWSRVLTTIAAIARLRPLSPDLLRIRSQARAALRGPAKPTVPTGGSTPSRSGGGSSNTSPGAHTHHASTPPAAGGSRPPATSGTSTTPNATPPANVPSGGVPPRPESNPGGGSANGGGSVSGQPAVAGDDGHEGHVH